MNKFTNYALPFADAFDGHSFTCDHEELFAWTYGYIPEEGDPLIDSAHFDTMVNKYMPADGAKKHLPITITSIRFTLTKQG